MNIRLLRTIALAVVLVGGASTAASAAPRYASPTGSGTTCSSSAPCPLVEAVTNASNNDIVQLRTGTYNLAAQLNVPVNLTIQGTPGRRPKIVTSVTGTVALSLQGTTQTLRDVEFAGPGVGLWMIASSASTAVTMDRVLVETTTAGASPAGYQAIAVRNLTLRDSIVRSVTDGGVAIVACDATISGSTIVANAGSGSRAISFYPGWFGATTCAATIRNSILVGGSNDFDVTVSSVSVTQNLDVDYTAYDASAASGPGTVNATIGGHNVSAAPLLVDLPGRTNLHQVAGSPTINAGDPAAPTSGRDIDGDLRAVGPGPDIGADEHTTPVVTTRPPTAVGLTTATLAGTIVPEGAQVAYFFDYGRTTAYGKRTTVRYLAATAPKTNVAAKVKNLPKNRRMHVRLVVLAGSGRRNGNDRAFVTNPAPKLGVVRLAANPVRRGQSVQLRFNLNERAGMVAVIDRMRPGHRVGSVCKLRATTGTACVVYTRRAKLSTTKNKGTPVIWTLPASPGGKPLLPGRYRIRVFARDTVTGRPSVVRTVKVTIT